MYLYSRVTDGKQVNKANNLAGSPQLVAMAGTRAQGQVCLPPEPVLRLERALGVCGVCELGGAALHCVWTRASRGGAAVPLGRQGEHQRGSLSFQESGTEMAVDLKCELLIPERADQAGSEENESGP